MSFCLANYDSKNTTSAQYTRYCQYQIRRTSGGLQYSFTIPPEYSVVSLIFFLTRNQCQLRRIFKKIKKMYFQLKTKCSFWIQGFSWTLFGRLSESSHTKVKEIILVLISQFYSKLIRRVTKSLITEYKPSYIVIIAQNATSNLR